EKFIITSTKPLVLKADQDNNEPGIATEFSAGLNTLWVHSGKAGDKWGAYDAGVLAPVYNSVYLVTPDMVKMYLTSVKILPANAYFKSSDTLLSCLHECGTACSNHNCAGLVCDY
ncbi:hypothetical protein, partial [Salmonella enterica]|uniref:hypothetical protein n=1 Tax=Salmonella enterica TaxID=28901 RepID=UPI00344B4F36